MARYMARQYHFIQNSNLLHNLLHLFDKFLGQRLVITEEVAISDIFCFFECCWARTWRVSCRRRISGIIAATATAVISRIEIGIIIIARTAKIRCVGCTGRLICVYDSFIGKFHVFHLIELGSKWYLAIRKKDIHITQGAQYIFRWYFMVVFSIESRIIFESLTFFTWQKGQSASILPVFGGYTHRYSHVASPFKHAKPSHSN